MLNVNINKEKALHLTIYSNVYKRKALRIKFFFFDYSDYFSLLFSFHLCIIQREKLKFLAKSFFHALDDKGFMYEMVCTRLMCRYICTIMHHEETAFCVHYFVLIRYSHDGWSVRGYTPTRVRGFYVPDHSFQLIREDKTSATIYFYVYYTR